MKDTEVIESLENAWRALCQQYGATCDEETRIALNLIGKITRKVKSKVAESNKKESNKVEQIVLKIG